MKKYELCTREELEDIISSSLSYRETCEKIGYKTGNKYKQILKQEKINYQKEYSFSDLQGEHRPLGFDFAIFSKDKGVYCLIECQGEEHTNSVNFWGGEEKFQKRIKYDSLKKQYCQDRNIPLILIPYKDYGILNKRYLYDKLREVD